MLIDSFLNFLQYEKNYSEKTINSYRVDLIQLEEYIKNDSEELTLTEVDADIIRQWIIDLTKKGYTTSSVNRKLSSLRSFYKFLLLKQEIIKDPTRKINGPKKKKPLPIFLKEKEINKILEETNFKEGFIEIRDQMIIEMFYATGIRLSELIGLDNKDINFEDSLIKVKGKRNKERLIPFGDELKESMLRYISVRNETITVKSEAFFIKENGERLYNALVERLVKRQLSKVVTLKKKSPHVLRHTFATAMLNNEANLNAIKEILGHTSLAATEVYTHTTFEELKNIYKLAHPRA
ncbi:tyrosine recombinase XerC subunit [Bacteroides luti]|uniref:Tyrosine recombinase XerC n=1 Tax=Bacteroides luti TaxID=1297750 RepID=A0A1M5D9T4_9BACE|nr:site-specific tyrosine recombinase/integron integrase [Bacteroides luti]SHF63823.1 tyrosine recombinase XerC subunit [Bacteroides luti]